MSIANRGSVSVTLKNRLFCSVVVLAIAPMLVATEALAQSASQTETIEVTGSRLKTTDAQSANPVTIVTSEDIAKTSATTVEDVLKKLPSVDYTGGISAQTNNGGVGASEVGLRNLGANRTLVLVNGQRFVNTDTQTASTAVDLNNIPVSMIDRIEVLRDGASSIYGADAIGGVINIITKQHYNGLQIDSSLGMTDKGDGLTYSNAVTAGADFDRGNILINVSQDHRDPVDQKNRSWATDMYTGTSAECSLCSSKLNELTGKVGGTGSTQIWTASGVSSNVANSSLTGLGNAYYSPANGRWYLDLSQEPYLEGELDRRQLNFTTHYDLASNVTAVLEAFYTDRHSEERLNPEPLSSTITTTKYPGLLIPSTNPYNTTGEDITLANYRYAGGGDRLYTDDTQTYRMRAGLQGTVFGAYDWEVGYVYGKSDATYRTYNEVNFSHLAQLTGQVACSAADALLGCSVGNFFSANGLTNAQKKYLEFTNTRTSQVEEDYAYATIGGPIYQLPAGPLQGSIGFEQRNESGFDNPDSVEVNGDGNQDVAPTAGAYRVTSLYSEINAPLLKNLPFIKALTVDASARYDYYTSFGRALTWKTGLDYAVNDDFRLRGSASTGFRAPQIKELFGGLYQNFPTVSGGDPCDTSNGASAGSASCVAALTKAGANASTFTSALNSTANPQITTVNGGNSSLKPETSQTFTAGTVFTPHWLPGASFTVDYYNILIRNQITSLGTSDILNACYGSMQLASACSLITRNSSGEITSVKSVDINFGYEKTAGIDLGASYGFDAEKIGLPKIGHFDVTGSASFLLKDDVLQLTGPVQQAGTFNLNTLTAEPRWKATVDFGYTRDDNWSFDYAVRYYGGVKNLDETSYLTTNPDGTVCTKGCGDLLGNHAPGVIYHDISTTYRYQNVKLTIGVQNLFDKDPPFIADGATNSLSGAGYDYIGRFVYLKTSIKF